MITAEGRPEPALDEGDGRSPAMTFVSNALETPADEGIRKCAWELSRAFAAHGIPAIAVKSTDPWARRKLFLDRRLTKEVRTAPGRDVLYLPSQSATPGTIARAGMMHALTGSRMALLALQPRPLGFLTRLPAGLRPSRLLSPSPAAIEEAHKVGLRGDFVPMGVDATKFRPSSPDAKNDLRRRHGVPEDRPVVLHVGHASGGRNLQWLRRIPQTLDATAVAVVGESRGQDRELVRQLRDGGVHVIDSFVPDVEEIYQLADCYVFTVQDDQYAIGVPLSVLEAMACGLPVVTTPFGGLPRMFPPGGGIEYLDKGTDPVDALRRLLDTRPDSASTRALALPFTWEEVARTIVRTMTSDA